MVRLAFAVFLVTGAVNLQLPLYGPWARDAGLGSGSMSLLLAGYVGALLLVLIPLGGVSDVLGRKVTVVAALIASLLATALVALDPGVVTLGFARWLQGFGVGLIMGSANAWMTEYGPARDAAQLTGLASTLGFGAGALGTALTGSIAGVPWTHPVFLVADLLCVAAVVRLPVLPPRGGALLRAPLFVPGTLAANLGIGVAWTVAGVVVAVLPGVLHAQGFGGLGGVALASLLGGGLIGQVHARRCEPALALLLGGGALTVGVGVLAVGVAVNASALVLGGAVIAGLATHGWLYTGGLASIARVAPGSSGAVSAFFLCAYLGFGMPAVLMGATVDRVGAGWAFAGLWGFAVVGSVIVTRAR